MLERDEVTPLLAAPKAPHRGASTAGAAGANADGHRKALEVYAKPAQFAAVRGVAGRRGRVRGSRLVKAARGETGARPLPHMGAARGARRPRSRARPVRNHSRMQTDPCNTHTPPRRPARAPGCCRRSRCTCRWRCTCGATDDSRGDALRGGSQTRPAACNCAAFTVKCVQCSGGRLSRPVAAAGGGASCRGGFLGGCPPARCAPGEKRPGATTTHVRPCARRAPAPLGPPPPAKGTDCV